MNVPIALNLSGCRKLLGALLCACLFVHSPALAQDEEPKTDEAPKPEGSPTDDQTNQPANEGAEDPAKPAEPPRAKTKVENQPLRDAAPPAKTLIGKRPVPDFRGRGSEPTTAGDVLIWVPRIAVSPIYLTTEFLVRRPLGGLVRGIEQTRVVQRLVYIFTLGGQPKVGLVPTFFVDFGFLPSAGFYFFWDDALVTHNHVRVNFGTWGIDWINAGVIDRYDVTENSTAAIRATFVRRRDRLFFGLGPDSREQLESRYSSTTVDVGPFYELRPTKWLTARTAAGFRATAFERGTCCGEKPLHDRIRDGEIAAPPRLQNGYSIGYQRAELALDSRQPRPKSQSGVRVAVDGEPAFDVSRSPARSWVSYSGSAGAFWDVTGKARVLSLHASALFADPLQGIGSDIPFTELVELGGVNLMRGFRPGRLWGRSAAVATLQYQFPIWVFLDGTLQASVGNVFNAGLRDFDTKKLRASTGFGFRTNTSPDNQFEFLVGFGTDTFEQGGAISSFRLALGATRGF